MTKGIVYLGDLFVGPTLMTLNQVIEEPCVNVREREKLHLFVLLAVLLVTKLYGNSPYW